MVSRFAPRRRFTPRGRRRPRRPGKWLRISHDTLTVPAAGNAGGRGVILLSGEIDGEGLGDPDLPWQEPRDFWVRRIIGSTYWTPNFNAFIPPTTADFRSFGGYASIGVLDSRLCDHLKDAVQRFVLNPTGDLQIDAFNEPTARHALRAEGKALWVKPNNGSTIGEYVYQHSFSRFNWTRRRVNIKVGEQFCLVATYNHTDDGNAVAGSFWTQLWVYIEY